MLDQKQVHFIGIGGIGVSALARLFLAHERTVSGSDAKESALTRALASEGAVVWQGVDVESIPKETDLVVYSRAVPEDHPERVAARDRGIQELSYPEALGELAKKYKTVAISGTNGKTTTTAMIATILIKAGFDPTVIVGSKVVGWEHENLRVGTGDWLVLEACEYMESMLAIQPNVSVITNIEADHLDYYRDIDHIRESFQKWIDCKQVCSGVVLNRDDAESQKLTAKYVDYFGVDNRRMEDGWQIFDVAGVEVRLPFPGTFNAQNAAASMTVARTLGIDDDTAVQALADFPGTWRRFERVGELNGAVVYSDYAHHPSAIRGTLEATRELFPERRIMAIFEPHQHSRTHELFDDFVEAFDAADMVIISEIYEVIGRTEEKFESSRDIVEQISKRQAEQDVHYAKDLVEAERLIREKMQDGDIILCIGAGAIDGLARKLIS